MSDWKEVTRGVIADLWRIAEGLNGESSAEERACSLDMATAFFGRRYDDDADIALCDCVDLADGLEAVLGGQAAEPAG